LFKLVCKKSRLERLFFFGPEGKAMTEDELYTELEPIAQSLSLMLVDCRMQQTKHGVAVQLVVYKAQGVGTEDCAALHRIVGPRLELLYDNKDVRLEITSPGLDRKFRTSREYEIFQGRGIHVVCKNGIEYKGILLSSTAATCTLGQGSASTPLAMADIAKVKLDYTQEGTTP
jgi:ribosome maturation factor RimP